MANQEDNLFKNVISHAKEYGFIFPSSEIYNGLSAVYDYGQNGSELKNNIKEYWWKFMTLLHDNIVGIDAAIFMHPTTWKASGHVDAFNDPMIDNKDSKKRYRADQLIEGVIEKLEEKIEKEVEKAAKRFENFNRTMFLNTNARVIEYQKKIDDIIARMKDALGRGDMADLKQLIVVLEIVDPVSGTKNWTEVRQFNLMFSTEMGSVADDANKIYLRPETAQGIFVNFLNVQKTGRMKIPFGVVVNTREENNFALMAADVEKAITPKTKIIALNFPTNPTGGSMPPEELEKIAALAVKHDLFVFTDEIYCELLYDGRQHKSIVEYTGMRERTVLLHGFSKAFAMTGWRLGYACAPAPLREAMMKVHQYCMLCAPIMSQIAGIEALKMGASAYEEMRHSYEMRRNIIVSRLNGMGLHCFNPGGAFYVFPEIPNCSITRK